LLDKISKLRSILRYITETLKEPVTAKRIYSAIKEQITAFNKLPLCHPLVCEEEYARRGLRKMPAENYLVFYTVNEAIKEVHILRILYNRREWQNFL
jgi:plasmid stabilization system protein ParE